MSWTAAGYEHLDEAAFVHAHWERVLLEGREPLISFVDGIDERWLAHIEALTRAPASALASWFGDALDGEREAGAVVAIALAILATGTTAGQETVCAALETHPEHAHRIARALDLCWVEISATLVTRLCSARSPPSAAALLRALGCRGRAPPPDVLEANLRSGDAEVRAAAWTCAPFANVPLRSWMAWGLSDPEARVRIAACQAGLSTGHRQAIAEARRQVDERRGLLDFAMSVLAVTGALGDLDRLRNAAQEPVLRRQAVWALGLSGWVDAVDVCLCSLADPQVADVAAEGFEALTAVRVRCLSGAPPPEEEPEAPPAPRTRWSAPAFSPAPPYDVDSARSSWVDLQRRRGLSQGRIYRGAPLTGPELVGALVREPLRRRHVLALELGARSDGRLRIDTLGWGWQQMATLQVLAEAPAVSVDRSLDALLG